MFEVVSVTHNRQTREQEAWHVEPVHARKKRLSFFTREEYLGSERTAASRILELIKRMVKEWRCRSNFLVVGVLELDHGSALFDFPLLVKTLYGRRVGQR